MYQLNDIDDTIAAISTATGQGGIGIVRLSGSNALAIADKIFKTKNKIKPSKLQNFSVHYGWVVESVDQEQILDEGLLTIMRGPKSYTKEDLVEISCHGGLVSLRSILNTVLNSGARLAEPGEFTKRAFLNGRIDLTQAEAVLDIIKARTDSFLKISTNQLKGNLSRQLDQIREGLMQIYMELEANVNFPEDEIDSKSRAKIITDVEQACRRVETLLRSSENGRILREGIKIVLCGKANVGKSSLLNLLLKEPRAIVSEIAGTTRDTIEESAQIKGIPFQLIDTAGFLEPRDLIEEEAIKRSHMHVEGADLVLFVLDNSHPLNQDDENLINVLKGLNVVVVLNKSDLKKTIDLKKITLQLPEAVAVEISALTEKGIDQLESVIVEKVWHGATIDTHGVMISNLRHIEALKRCLDTLRKIMSETKEGLSFEFISEDIKCAVNSLDSITGRNIDVDLLENIFSQFCIGK